MRTGHGDNDSQIPHTQIPNTMHSGERPHRKLGDDLLGDTPHLGFGTGMTRIAERLDIGTPVMIPHGPHEERGPPGGVVPHGPKNLIQRERLIPNSKKLDGLRSALLTRMITERCHTPIVPSQGAVISARPASEDEAVQAELLPTHPPHPPPQPPGTSSPSGA